MKRTIEVPRDLCEQLSRAEQLRLRFYIENEGVTVRFTAVNRKKFTKLFHSILQFEKRQGES